MKQLTLFLLILEFHINNIYCQSNQRCYTYDTAETE